MLKVLTFMKQVANGMAIIFETADTQSFTRKSLPNTKPLKRPDDWMKLDLILVPVINL